MEQNNVFAGDQQNDFDFDLATMALKGRRFQEAGERFINLASRYNRPEAWCGLGIAKLGLILEAVTGDEVFYCFDKARLATGADKKDIDRMVLQATGEVTRRLYELGANATLSAQKADKTGKIAFISTVIIDDITLASQTEGRQLKSLVAAVFSALNYKDYLKAGATAADCRVIIEKVKSLIIELRSSLLAYLGDSALKDEFNELTEQCRNEFEKAVRTAPVRPPDLNPGNTNDDSKWYNNKGKLWLSILLWPLMAYGIYKTRLLQKKTKQIIAGAFVLLLLIGSFGKHDGSSSFSGGPRQSPFDNSVAIVEIYLKYHYLRDPGSYESIRWSKVEKNSDGTFQVTHEFRAKNGFGGFNSEIKTFTISTDGEQVIAVQ